MEIDAHLPASIAFVSRQRYRQKQQTILIKEKEKAAV